jgi:hypothetical protein
VAHSHHGQYVPASVPGEDLNPEDMSRVSDDDWADIRKLARGYCRTVDATRSRKRMDGSATVVKSGYAPYGTDDVSDDVTQDAVLIFATRLRDILKSCAASSVWVDTRETASWLYIRKDGQVITITRQTLQRWAVRDAAARNGYRLDIQPDETDNTPGAQTMRGLAHAEHVPNPALAPAAVSQLSEAVWRTAYGDGSDFPTLRDVLFLASEADHLGRAGILATAAQSRYGGAYNSRRNVIRVRDRGAVEFAELSARLDDARDEMTCRTVNAR